MLLPVSVSVSASKDLMQSVGATRLLQSSHPSLQPQWPSASHMMIFAVYFCLKHIMEDVIIFIDLENIRILQDIHIIILTVQVIGHLSLLQYSNSGTQRYSELFQSFF